VQTIDSRAYDMELNSTWTPSDKLNLVSGIQCRRAPRILNAIVIPTVTGASQRVELMPGEALTNWGIFTQLNYQYNEKWKWIGGIRLQQTLSYDVTSERPNTPKQVRTTDSTSLRVIPRVAAIYTPNSSHIFKFLYGHAENNPSFMQLFIANDNNTLKPEEIQTLEMDYLTYLSPHYLLSVNLFRNKLQGLLTRQLEVMPDNTLRAFTGNAGHWKTQGAELTLQAQPTEAWQLEWGATYQTTQNLDNSEIAIAYSPHLLGQMKLAYRVDSKTQVSLTGYYVSEMESYFDPTKKNADGGLGTRIGDTGGNYAVLGANIRLQDWWIKGLFANLRVSNLLNQEIRYPTTLENTWADKGLVGYGRTFMLNVGYQFH
jgi:outer membrane receptor protein involved in Fe transport